MPSLDRRRRRRPWGTILLASALAVLSVFFLVGGVIEVGRGSRPYWQEVDRSYAAQGALVVQQSNKAGAQLESLMASMPSLDRKTLQQGLDTLASDTANQAAAAGSLAPPAPAQGLDQPFAAALAARALAASELRTTVDGFLGMSPLPVAGAPATSGGAPQTPGGSGTTKSAGGANVVLLTAEQANVDLLRVGALISQADRSYATARRSFLSAPGDARLPPSVWVRNPQLWAPGPIATLVGDLGNSPSLAAVHRVQLIAVQVDPSPVPSLGAPAASSSVPPGGSVVPPTTSLAVTAVVANYGNVGEAGVAVSASLQPASGGAPATSSAHVDLQPGASVAVPLPSLRVVPGSAYGLTVAVAAPPGQTQRDGLAASYSLSVAPQSPPSTPGT